MGRSLDSLNLKERLAIAGKTVALEVYTPEGTPLRTIEAIGDSAGECMAQLEQRDLDPSLYEFMVMRRPY